MAYEIERKFLVDGDYKSKSFKAYPIKQGYLSLSGVSVVRVRLKGEKAYITVKSSVVSGTLKRNEWEYEIPKDDAEEMLKLCEEGLIDKTRYLVKVGKHVFEVDEFNGDNEGLLIAEVELEHEDEHFEKPEWLGEEVTDNVRYYNSFLSIHPYNKWNSLNE
jgi:CYTH domain-containing protein